MPATDQHQRPDWVMPPEAGASPPPAPPSPARLASAAATAAIVVVALLVGAGVTLALTHRSSANAAAQAPGGVQGAPQGGFQGGPQGDFQGGPGGLTGEQRLAGTVTASTPTTVTVRSAAGTATYTVDGSSQIVRDGQRASLSEIQAGDTVLVHSYPSGGKLMVERLFADSSAGGAPGAGFDPPDGDGGQTT